MKILKQIITLCLTMTGLSFAQDYYPSASETYYATQQTVQAIINSPIHQSSLINREQNTSNYFRARQMNKYYMELEQLQRKELNRMKRDGSLDTQNLNRLFNVNY